MAQIECSVSSEYREKAKRATEILSRADFPDNILVRDLVRVVLYGSVQRDEENPGDIDLCLVSEFPGERAGWGLARAATPILQRRGINVDPEQITVHLQGIGIDAWERPDEAPFPELVHDIRKGEILFDRSKLMPEL